MEVHLNLVTGRQQYRCTVLKLYIQSKSASEDGRVCRPKHVSIKRSINENCCILLVVYIVFLMMHGLTNVKVYIASVALTSPLHALREKSLYSDACKSCTLHSKLIKREGSFLITKDSNNSPVLFSCLTTVSNQSDASEIRHSLAVFLSYWLAFSFLSLAWTE